MQAYYFSVFLCDFRSYLLKVKKSVFHLLKTLNFDCFKLTFKQRLVRHEELFLYISRSQQKEIIASPHIFNLKSNIT